MSELYLAAEEYLANYSYTRALNLMCIEFNISRFEAATILSEIEQNEFAYCGA